jgi:hypothetical protein
MADHAMVDTPAVPSALTLLHYQEDMFYGALNQSLAPQLKVTFVGAIAFGLTITLGVGLYQRIFSNTDQYTGHGLLMIFGLVFSLVVTAVQLLPCSLGSVFQLVLQASGVTQVILGLMASFLLSSCLMSVLLDYFVHGRSVVPVNLCLSHLDPAQLLHIVPEWYLLPVYQAVEQSMKACRLSMDTQLVLDLGLAVFAQQIVHHL